MGLYLWAVKYIIKANNFVGIPTIAKLYRGDSTQAGITLSWNNGVMTSLLVLKPNTYALSNGIQILTKWYTR